jgi:trehalose 6-phosphate phosphatase
VVFLDYDGTLAPISIRPELAIMPYDTRRVLYALVKKRRVSVSIISGRILRDVKKLVGVKGIYYAGCHGLEIEGTGSYKFSSILKYYRLIIRNIKKPLMKGLADIVPLSYVDIEDKGMILSLHYRRVDQVHIRGLKKVFYKVSRPYIESGKMVITQNKKVVELRPNVKWDKGEYCIHLLKKIDKKSKKALPVYIGDDRTDEAAFKALEGKGITIFVKGERKSSLAEYYVNSTSEVKSFLQFILKSLRTKTK